LAIEGGGMRGVVTAAMIAVLFDKQLEGAFDAVYAYSSGAMNAAYFLAKQVWYGLSIYYNELLGSKFYSQWRFFQGRPMLSLDYVMNEVLEILKPLDYAAVLSSPIALHIAASSITEGKTKVFHHFQTREELKQALKATICLPIAAGRPVSINNEQFIDGGVLLAHPILTALEDQCTHIVVIRNRKRPSFPWINKAAEQIMAQYLQRYSHDMGHSYLDTLKQYDQLRQELPEKSLKRQGPPYILDVPCPDDDQPVTRFTQNRGILLQGLESGYRAMLEALGDPTGQVYFQVQRTAERSFQQVLEDPIRDPSLSS
jgi:predicted patatin/cPLA2 family phospholipase